MGLFATLPIDEVTVQDVATAVDMTPAAVYYHFASKEQILLEGMSTFRDGLVAELQSVMPSHADPDGIRTIVVHLVGWVAKHRTAATVFFVSSIGLNLIVEALRRETRLTLIGLLRQAVTATRGRLGSAEAGVIAVALVSLLETSLASMLNQDATYRSLGTRKFANEVANIADRIAGLVPHPA